MSRNAAVNSAALRGARPLSPRALQGLLLFLALALFAALASLRPAGVDAASQEQLTIVPVASNGALDDLVLSGATYGQVSAQLAGTGQFEVPLDIPGLGQVGPFQFEATEDPGSFTIRFATAPVDLNAGPLDGVPVRLMLLADWADASDNAPDVALAVRTGELNLDQLFPAFGAIPGMSDGLVPLDSAVLIFSATGTFTLDPALLPDAIDEFLGVDGHLAEPLLLSNVASLLANLDRLANEQFADAARFLGIDPAEALLLAGALSDTAAFLFDAGATIDPAEFSLEAPIVVDTAQLPAWLQNQLPAFRLEFTPAGQPSARIQGTALVETAGVSNDFAYDVSVAEAAGFAVTLQSVGSFDTPYGLAALGWDGDLESAELSLSFAELEQPFSASFDAVAQVGGTAASVHIAVNDVPANTTGIVSIDGAIPVPHIVSWLTASAINPGGLGDQLNFTAATVDSLEFSFDAADAETVFGLYGVVSGIGALGGQGLRAQLLVGVDTAPSTLLVALRIDDEDCTDPPGNCIDLNQVFATPAVTLDLDLRLPAVNFAVMVPNGGAFSTSKLGPKSKAFLDLVNGTPAVEPYTITGNLNFMADVPVSPLTPLLTPLGITAPATLHVRGSAGFTFEFLDGGQGTLDNFDVTANLGPVTASAPQGWPSWLAFPAAGSENWTFFLRFAEGDPGTDDDDALELGTEVSGITSELFPDVPELALSASFTGTVSGLNPSWTVTAKAAIGTWTQPFGVEFLTVNSASAVLTIHQPAIGDLEVSAQLCGTFTIDPVVTTVCFSITSVDPVSATFSIELDEPVSLQAILAEIPALSAVTLPGPVGSIAVGPGELAFTVTGDGEFSINAVISASFEPVASHPVGVDLMLSANFGTGTPAIAVGVQPHPGVTLGGLFGLPDLPVDLPLSPGDPNTGFAFVYTNTPGFDPNAPGLPQSIRDWFLPLYGGDMTGKTLTNTAGVIGAFRLPAPLDEFAQTLGLDPNILVGGGISLEPLDVNMTLTLRAQAGVLPDFVAGAEVTMGVSLEVGSPTKLAFFLEGHLYLKLKQGMDAELASQLEPLSLDLPVAEPVGALDACPRGGFNLASYLDDGDMDPDNNEVANFCYDMLDLELGAELSVSVTPPEVSLRVFASMTSMNEGGEYWRPLGIEEIGIGSLGAEIEISFAAGPPLSLNLKLGLYGDIDVFGYTMSAGIKVGASVVSAPTPIGIAVTPNFDGLRLAFPDGIETNDVVDIANVLGGLVSPPVVVPYPDPDLFPNIGLKNLYFSISPLGAPTICIEQGLIFRGDLYINPDVGLDFDGGPPCEPDQGPPPNNFPINPDESCQVMKEEGCVASVLFSLTPSGLIAQAFLAGFEIPQLDMRFDDTLFALRLTADDQYIRLHGGVEIGPIEEPTAVGRMSVDIKPLSAVFAGQIKAFGFNALVDGTFSADPVVFFTGEGPDLGLTLHVVLAAPELALPQYGSTFPDFTENVKADLERTVGDIADVIAFIETTADDFDSHPFRTLGGLPERLEDAGYTEDVTPEWADEILSQIAVVDALLISDDREEGGYSFFELLNGFQLAGVPGAFVECAGYVDEDGNCWGLLNDPPVCTGFEIEGECWLLPPFGWGGFCSSMPAAIKNDDGECTKAAAAAELERALGELVTSIGALAGAQNVQQVLDAADDWLSGDFVVFDLQCASLDVELLALAESEFDIALDGTLLDNNFLVDFGWEFDDPLGSAGRLFAQLLGGGGTSPCVGVDPALFGPDGLGNPDSINPDQEEELPPLTVNVSVTPAAVFEGASVAGSVTLNRPVDASDGDVTAIVDWGDGSPASEIEFGVGDTSKPVAHLYADDNPSGTSADSLTVTATLDAPHSGQDTTVVTVKNRAPAGLVLGLSQISVNEGGEVELTVNWTDLGIPDTHSLRIDWGDGSPIQVLANAASGGRYTHTYVDDRPSGTSSDLVTISVRVRDDDLGTVTGTVGLTVVNLPPVANSIAITPDSVDEGEEQQFTITWDDPGLLDSHRVFIDWDGDATTDEIWRAGNDRSLTVTHVFVDDHPQSGTASDVLNVGVRVVDDDTGATDFVYGITVDNVAPALCLEIDPEAADPVFDALCDASLELTFDEFGTLEVRGVFQDQGVLDTHVVTIDWGFEGFADTTFTFEPDPASPELTEHTFEAGQVYGDNGVFTITVTVEDDDTGEDVATVTLTVNNIDPDVAIDEPSAVSDSSGGTILADGPDDDGVLDEPTFVVRQGAAIALTAQATDPGSDDLAFQWDWDAGGIDPATTPQTSLVNPPSSDPPVSPTWQPRSETMSATHVYTQACLYNAVLGVWDDDGGTDSDGTWIVVTGTDSRIRAPGYWYNQYDATKGSKNTLDSVTLDCYLKVVRHMSRVFNSFLAVDNFEAARDILNTKQTSEDRQIMTRQLLAAWLNFANGSVGWFTMVDTNGDRKPDRRFGEVMLESESLRLNNAATRAQLLAQEALLKSVNGD